MKLYLAAGFSRKHEMQDKSSKLERLGYEVISSWPWEEIAPTTTLAECTTEHLLKHGRIDIKEIENCDALLLFTQDPSIPFCRGGRMHEAGYAHALGKHVVVIGPRENIFHYLPEIGWYPTFDAFLDAHPGL